MSDSPTLALSRTTVDFIPLLWIDPATAASPRHERELVIWLTGFGGTKESVEPQLRDLAAAGFVALSFDPWQHGERAVEPPQQLRDRVHANIRRHFWPILAHTAEETPRVIDWAIENFGVTPRVRMGGVSMGGDIAVAAAAVDRRIGTVATCVATPDWLRPGSHQPPGDPDTYARNCYDRRNPITHLDQYAHRPAITFQCAAMDTMVPPDGARRFAAALAPTYAATPERLDVTLHADTAHAFTESMWRNCLKWFERF